MAEEGFCALGRHRQGRMSCRGGNREAPARDSLLYSCHLLSPCFLNGMFCFLLSLLSLPHPTLFWQISCSSKEAPQKTSWMRAVAVGEVSVTLTSARACFLLDRARCLPFLPTYGQELEKCVLGTEIIPLNDFSH